MACTSTLFQNNASFALLKKIKEKDTSIVIIMGGANCSEISGLAMVRQYE